MSDLVESLMPDSVGGKSESLELVSSRTLELISDRVLSMFIDILMEIIYSLSHLSLSLSRSLVLSRTLLSRGERMRKTEKLRGKAGENMGMEISLGEIPSTTTKCRNKRD
jgi:hypothetical protein